MSSDQHVLLWRWFYSQLRGRAAESVESLESIGLLLFPAANKAQKVRVHTRVLFQTHIYQKKNCISRVSFVEMRNLCALCALQWCLPAASHSCAVTWSHCQVFRMQLDSFILLHLFKYLCKLRFLIWSAKLEEIIKRCI